ncbi:hypothetical protein B0H11DRAFT_2214648 [Mycena galericulata]|nr:hypothetical protein B0H11DRAFT_2214648 [Mycena galericulata]
MSSLLPYCVRLVAFINLLPKDVLTFLLEFCCGPYFSDIASFSAARLVLSNVCRLWRRIIISDVSLWNAIGVNRTQTLTHIDYLLARNRSNPFRLLVDFRPAPYHDGCYHDPPLPAIVNMLLPHFVRLRSLVIYAGSTDILSILHFNRAHLHMPDLASLFIHRSSSTYPVPISLFPSMTPSLRTLVLSVIPFSSLSPGSLPCVSCLVLRDFTPQTYPRVDVFLSLLDAVPHLLELSLDRFGVLPLLNDAFVRVLPRLATLHLALHSNASVVTLLGRLLFPSLLTLAVSFTSAADSHLLLRCPTLLASVSTVHFDGRAPPVQALISFIDIFASLREFQAPYLGLSFLHALDSVMNRVHYSSGFFGCPLPLLEHMGLGNIQTADVTRLLPRWSTASSTFTTFTFWCSDVTDPDRALLPDLTSLVTDVRFAAAIPIASRRFARVGLQ